MAILKFNNNNNNTNIDKDDPAVMCDNWQFPSLHVLVNRERLRWNRSKLERSPTLDLAATRLAVEMIQDGSAIAAKIPKEQLQTRLQSGDAAALVQAGRHDSLRHLHSKLCKRQRRTLLLTEFRQFGIGTARNDRGDAVLVLLLRGEQN